MPKRKKQRLKYLILRTNDDQEYKLNAEYVKRLNLHIDRQLEFEKSDLMWREDVCTGYTLEISTDVKKYDIDRKFKDGKYMSNLDYLETFRRLETITYLDGKDVQIQFKINKGIKNRVTLENNMLVMKGI